MLYRSTAFAVYFISDVWKLTPKLTFVSGAPIWQNTSVDRPIRQFDHRLKHAYDTTPNVTDMSRYPVFLRQGKGTGDPYAGLKVRWPNIPLVQDGRLGDSLVHFLGQQRLCSARRACVEPDVENG